MDAFEDRIMCDFRGPPHAIRDLRTNEVIEVGNCKSATATNNGTLECPRQKDVIESGMYHISATGAYYSYFDGQEWWHGRGDYGPPSTKYWQDTDGVPPWFCRYEFLRTPENECSQLEIHSC